ncbi:MAG TPA: DinB family protein [Mycobacteriales bacterium]|nr:DinB family protein [Mycobacteriales bacterium]
MAEHRADVFLDPAADPREGAPSLLDEKGTLQEYLRSHRLTLELKCADLDAEQLACRSVPPSTMSLLGLVRHMAHVERVWFKIRCDQQDVPRLYQTEEDPDGDFNGAVPDPACVEDAWARWREEVTFAEQYVEACADLATTYTHPRDGSRFSMRELLVHMIEEYARHNGHADLLRECVDGRVGQ